METNAALIEFNPKAIATFGNQMLTVLVEHEEAKENAERAMRQAGEREKVIDFELARVALHLHADEKIDLYQIFDAKRESSTRLYRTILLETGALARTVDEETDKVIYDFTDATIKGKFDFNEELKEKDEEEYKKRRSRRNGLNMRLARVCKAALALAEANATTDDMKISQGEDGELNAVITKGPSEVMGKEGEVQIHSKSVSPVEGASSTPTITGLAKLSDKKHKEEPASKNATETTTRDEIANQDFLAIINAAIVAVRAKEGTVDAQEAQVLKNLLTEIQKCVK